MYIETLVFVTIIFKYMPTSLRLSISFLCFFSFFHISLAQVEQVSDSLTLRASQTFDSIQIATAYQELNARIKTAAIQTLEAHNFNKGIISDPLLLSQGLIAGTQSYNRDNDPNQKSVFRIRGLNRFAQSNTPFVIIDGVAGANLHSIDVNDIQSISILNDASAQAMYGMRSANGVIVIETKHKKFLRDTMAFSYHGQVGTSIVDAETITFSAEEFIAEGGNDFGSSNVWRNEILRNTVSQTHGLALQGRKLNTHFNLSTNLRNVDGILKNSGFSSYNVRGQVARKFLNNKLRLTLMTAYTQRTSDLGIPEAFRQAISFNPTAPILAEDAPFPFSIEQFGGYFETVGLFRSYNPVALVDLNQRKSKNKDFLSSVHLSLQANSNIAFNLRYTRQNSFENRRAFYSPFSNFKGFASSPIQENKGQADLLDVDNDFSLYEAFVQYKNSKKGLETQFTLGTSFHDGRYTENFLQINGFNRLEALDSDRFENNANLSANSTSTESISNAWNDDIFSFFAAAQIRLLDDIYVHASLRSDATSKLQNDNSRGLFSGIGAAIDIKNILQLEAIPLLHARISYGMTGGIPSEGGLTRRKLRTIQYADGSTEERTIHNGNPQLGFEKKKELNFGFDFGLGVLRASIDAYQKSFADGIGEEFTTAGLRFNNLYDFNSKGIDLSLQAKLIESSSTKVSMGLQLSTYSSKAQNVPDSLAVLSSPGGIFQEAIVVLANDQNVGSIYAPEFNGNVSPEGFPIFSDLNQDGSIVTAPSLFDPDGDFANLGTGTPSLELGWFTQIDYKGWQCYANLRGAFGHLLVNRTRLLHEVNSIFSDVYNRVNTELAVPALSISSYSSLYVEKANFIKLDNLSIAKQLNIFGHTENDLTISLTAQNLFTISNYTGNNPEPALEAQSSIFINSELDYYKNKRPVAGIDRRNSYLPSKTFTLGIQVNF